MPSAHDKCAPLFLALTSYKEVDFTLINRPP